MYVYIDRINKNEERAQGSVAREEGIGQTLWVQKKGVKERLGDTKLCTKVNS